MQQYQISQSQRIQTFGSLQIYNSDGALFLKGEKIRSLLAYLILHPRILHRREMLADLLWPDSPPDRVRRNLSDLVYRLQKIAEPGWLKIDSDTIALQPNADLWVDVWEFDDLITGKDPGSLQRAVELYGGDLLSEIYDEWILAERELRRSQYLSALEILSTHYESQGELSQALLCTRRIILTEPLHEPAHQTYLRLLGRVKRFGEALAHYEYLRKLIRAELSSEPMAETHAIARSLARERDLESVPAFVEETSLFIGRKAERAAALTVVEQMLKGAGGVLTVEGEAGIGKSRLLREIAEGARWRGAAVLQGQASELPAASPFSPLAEALQMLISSLHGPQLEALLPHEVLIALAPIHPAWGDKDKSQEPSLEQADRRFYSVLKLLGETLANLAPMLIVLDDVHWTSSVFWQCLRTFAAGFVPQGGLLILAYRRPEIENVLGWETIQAWDRDGVLKTISLEPFNIEEVAQLLGKTGFDPVEIHAWTGGNPFFIHEWLADPESKRPASHSAISLRLQSLSPSARVALESASILGKNIPFRLWMEISELQPLMLASLSDELMARHWLEPSASGYSFVHDLIRASVFDEIAPDRRRTLHERAARAYQALEPENVRSLAFHLDRAGLLDEAVGAYRHAGEQDLKRFAYREAQAAFERALALLPSALTMERLETMLSLAWALDILGERQRELFLLEEVLSGAGQLCDESLEVRARLALGRAKNQTNEYANAEKHLVSALRLARKLQDEADQIEAYLLLGMNKTGLRHTKQSIRYYKLALKLAQKTSSLSQKSRALRGLGIAARDMGLPHESIKWLQQALQVQHQIGDRLDEGITQSNLVTAYYDLGSWDQIIATAEEILPRVEALGYRYNAGYLRHIQGLAFYNLGDYSNARQRIVQAGRDFEAAGAKTTLFHGVLGLIAEDQGNYEEALRLYRLALASIESVEEKRETPILQLDLGTLLWQLERPQEAIPSLEAARAIWLEEEDKLSLLKTETILGLAKLTLGERSQAEQFAASGWTVFQAGIPAGEKPQAWLWALHQLLAELEQPDAARVVLQAAYTELQRQARAISNPELCRSFFTNVPLNRTIVAACDQLSKVTRVISVSLAHRGAALGRSLQPDDYVQVSWTVSAPEDESIIDKTTQRHYRLRRLLQEAEVQGAAPTDADLAAALGVSRRTILRDMQIFSKENIHLPTRKRKSRGQSGILSQ